MIATELEPGSVVAGHRIESVINSGGMGIVFSAVDMDLDRRVAFKVIKPEHASDEHFRERFQREAKLMASINHPNIIQIWRCGEENGLLYVSMQLVEGTDLAAVIDENGRLPIPRAARIVADVAAALDVAHSHGVVHRDVKPQNILLDERTDDEGVVLTDFGLAKRLAGRRSELFKTGGFVGTPMYAAPEQTRSERVDARADVYALGGVLFHAVTGRVPFDVEDIASLLLAHLAQPPPRVTEVVADVPRELDSIVEKALAKRPDERYDSAGDLAQAVLSAAGQAPLAEPIGSVATGAAAPGGESDFPPLQTDSPVPEALPASTRAQLKELLRRAEGHRTRHRYANALEEFQRALELVPDWPDALAGRGHTHLCQRRVDDALADFEAALQADPLSIYALTGRGAARLTQRRHDEALDDYKRALAVDAGSVDALVGYADALTRLRRYAAARGAVESALAIDAEAIDGLRLEAVLAVQSRRPGVARAAADKAVALDPNSAQVYATRAFVRLAKPDLEGALEDLERACEIDERDAGSRALRGLVLVRLGRVDDGLEDLDLAIKLDEGHVEARAWRAVAAKLAGRVDEPDAGVATALELHPESGSAHLAAALQELQAGRPRKALADIDRALELDRTGVMTWFGRENVHLWRARVALELGRYNEVTADCARALKAAPGSADAHLVRSRALLELGRAADALEDLDAARALDPSPRILVQRAEALFALDRYGEGLADLDAAAAAAPASAEVAEARRRAARELPVPPALAEQVGPAFSQLAAALGKGDLGSADQLSVAILRAAAGQGRIDSEAAALAIDERVLLKLDTTWRAAGSGAVRERPWVRSPEVTAPRGRLRLQTWLAWRLRKAGL